MRAHGTPSEEAIRVLARETGLPTSQVRAALDFYADLEADAWQRPSAPSTTRLCRGTSCELSGAASLAAALASRGGARDVYCLGYCDRSPALLRDSDAPIAPCTPEGLAAEAPRASALPAIRCLAPRPIVSERLLAGDHADLARARAAGVYAALEAALAGPAEAVLDTLERSGERGRGGAGFPTAAKWRACAEAPGEPRIVIANGDEGDPGSFVDRVLLESDPHAVLEGMLLCAHAVGASQGIVFVRSEYPRARAVVEAAVRDARAAGLLGESVLGSDLAFEVRVVEGRGSYVCGEETALLNAVEGLRGEVRLRPPYPARAGLRGLPTVVNNVETFANVPAVLRLGAEAYARLGTYASSGTLALCLNRGFARPGLVEVEFGTPLRAVIEDAGGGADGRPLAAVLLGGPMGSVLPPDRWDVPVCYGAMAERGIQLGHGGLVAVPGDADLRALLLHQLRFMRDESCGRCVPCALGTRRALALAEDASSAAEDLDRVFDVMERASLCAFGQLTPGPARALLRLAADRTGGGPA